MSLKEKRKSLREELVRETCLSDEDINFIISKINRKIEQLKKRATRGYVCIADIDDVFCLDVKQEKEKEFAPLPSNNSNFFSVASSKQKTIKRGEKKWD